MLERLLNEIRKGGSMHAGVLAARLGLSVPMVDAMLAGLKSMGVLQEVDSACNQPCGGCPLESSCAPQGSQGRLWVLARRELATEA